MEENKEVNDINIHSETADKVIDVVVNSTKQTRNALDKNTAKSVNKFFQLLSSTKLGVAIDAYIEERPYKLEQARQKMLEKYNKIPTENLIEPRTSNVLTVAKEFDYYLDEEHIKEMFINILISDMDTRKHNNVLPSYIDVVKQLSKEDAEFLVLLKNKKLINDLPISRMKLETTKDSTFNYVSDYYICLHDNEYIPIKQLVLDNLLRLNIIQIPYDIYVPNITCYNDIFNILKEKPDFKAYLSSKEKILKNTKEKLRFTDFGKNFIDICLS